MNALAVISSQDASASVPGVVARGSFNSVSGVCERPAVVGKSSIQQVVATARLNITVNILQMKWTTTFSKAGDAVIQVPGNAHQLHIEEIPEDADLDQMLVVYDNTVLDCTNPDLNERDVLSWSEQIMTFRFKPKNLSLRIQYPQL